MNDPRIPMQEDPEWISLYSKRDAIHPRAVHGRFQQLRDVTVWATLGGYLLLPWLQWPDGDGGWRQAVLFDLPGRQFHIFGVTFWPQDFILLSWLLISLAFALFLVTVLAGRVYCGYVCPQTTWTRFFTWIEKITEGDRHARIRLDKSPWHRKKILRRGSKHILWWMLASLTGITFVGYFTPIGDLLLRAFTWELGQWEIIWIAFFTGATYVNAGWLREQVCIYMCPYARFQSVMFDRNTLIVSYDTERGEPRKRGRRKEEESGIGDCIDCELCVQVCPTGIDIREGLQYECIGCAACVDACDAVMKQVDLPVGLIRYTTENALQGRPTDWFRPRLLSYGAMLLIMVSVLGYALATRVPLGIDVMRDRGQLYRTASDGMIENSYQLVVMNRSQQTRDIRLSLQAADGLHWQHGEQQIQLPAGATRTLPITLAYDPYTDQVSTGPVWFILEDQHNVRYRLRRESRFIAPAH
ncbi:MAG: cytochrome c oxidase accessory protein CcoG [Alcanivorax sp.]|nr:cytochrome c oxidase accessory protein CcoG [Alcanivorax sp.]